MNRLSLLFVCIGNACRSQMAEGFARSFGDDFLDVASAGLMPINTLPMLTRQVMIEKGIPIDEQFPKGIEVWRQRKFDVVVNMSGTILPRPFGAQARNWTVADPYGQRVVVYRQVRDEIEERVRQLVEELRQNAALTEASQT